MKTVKLLWAKSAAKLKLIFSVVDWKDVLIRSVKTFFQAAFACVATALADGSIVTDAGQVFWLSALSAGIAAVWNGVLSPAIRIVHNKADEEI